MRWFPLVALVALAAGCQTRIYQVRLEPTAGDGLLRTLTVWQERSGQTENLRFGDHDLRRLKELYAEQPSAPEDLRQTFRGTFAGRMPADVGGFGTYRRVETPLGTAFWYLERFRGTTDPDGELYDRRAAIDRAVDLAVGWFDLQLKDALHRDAVHRFLDRDLRQDVRNVAFYVWLASSDDSPDVSLTDHEEGPGRVPANLLNAVQYLVEHAYLDPAAGDAVATMQSLDSKAGLRMVRQLLARKCELEPARADELFPFLTDWQAVQDSWMDYLRTTPEYARRMEAWKPSLDKPDELTGPNPLSVLEDLLAKAVTMELLGKHDELRLTLLTTAAPHESNGVYEASTGTVAWRKQLHGRRELPTVCYAAWTVPNERFQTAHFGKTAVESKSLAKFAALFGQLNAAQQAEIAAHLQTIEPGDALRGRAADFQFVEPADEAAKQAAEQLLGVLYESL